MGLTEPKLFILLIIVLVIFGPKNLPRLAQALGRSVRELKNGMAGITDDVRDNMQTPPAQPTNTIQNNLPTPNATVTTTPTAAVETHNPTTPKSV